MKKEDIAKVLRDRAYSESSRTERLYKKFEENDSYKVGYRLISNFLTRCKRDFGMNHFPTEEETIEIAKLVSPYFVELFKNKDKLGEFKATYDFHKEVWEEMIEF